ncbi:MAG: sugar transferase [Bacteroidales bacterium]|nr:sugar transferase [Bacteroidales bacterium]
MYRNCFKRVFDLIGSLILMPFVLLEILILAPLIWITDRGPVFYNATRAGQNYKPYKMFKLRSMYVNSPDLRNSDGSTYSSDDDARVTPIGRILRKASLDEFPQLINVLLGQMSLVGPRPKLWRSDRKVEEMDENRRKSYSVKPGVTGYAQAYYRNSITQEEKFKWDAYYADNVSLWLDIKILWQTVISVACRKNINTAQADKSE